MARSGDQGDVTSFTNEQVDALTDRASGLLDQLREILGEMSSRLQDLTQNTEGERERPDGESG